jgi:DNA repair protein RadC
MLPRLFDALLAPVRARDLEGGALAAAAPGAVVAVPVQAGVAARRTRGKPPASDVELIARVAGVSHRRAEKFLTHVGGLSGLAASTAPEIRAGGMTAAATAALLDVVELGRRAAGARPLVGRCLRSQADVFDHMRARLAATRVEEFWTIALNTRNRVLFDECIGRGSLTGVEVHPRDVFRPLIRAGAASVLFAHNHPSGCPEPSRQDIELTARLREVGELCGIVVVDHVIVGTDGYVSLAQRKWR